MFINVKQSSTIYTSQCFYSHDDYLTQQKSTLAMVDDDYAILKLRGQVKRETGPGKTGMDWRNLDHHIIHNVLTKYTHKTHLLINILKL